MHKRPSSMPMLDDGTTSDITYSDYLSIARCFKRPSTGTVSLSARNLHSNATMFSIKLIYVSLDEVVYEREKKLNHALKRFWSGKNEKNGTRCTWRDLCWSAEIVNKIRWWCGLWPWPVRLYRVSLSIWRLHFAESYSHSRRIYCIYGHMDALLAVKVCWSNVLIMYVFWCARLSSLTSIVRFSSKLFCLFARIYFALAAFHSFVYVAPDLRRCGSTMTTRNMVASTNIFDSKHIGCLSCFISLDTSLSDHIIFRRRQQQPNNVRCMWTREREPAKHFARSSSVQFRSNSI